MIVLRLAPGRLQDQAILVASESKHLADRIPDYATDTSRERFPLNES
jgi:hypothetical protein